MQMRYDIVLFIPTHLSW